MPVDRLPLPKDDAILRDIQLSEKYPHDWSRYPLTIPAIAKMGIVKFAHGVTFFVGENGSGKSTFIEAIAIKAGFNPEGGTKNFTSKTRPTESILHEGLWLARGFRKERSGFFLRAETMFNIVTEAEDYQAYGWEKLHEVSHGEATLWIALNRFVNGGLYILDEPEAALSPQRQLVLLARIHELVQGGAQFVIATHSPILMAYPGAKIYKLDEKGIHSIEYEQTEHFIVTRAFLMNREKMLMELFGEEEAENQEEAT
jgi:predicted ATPase